MAPVGENLEQAAQVLREFTDEGNSDAQELLATCYLHGIGVQKDPEKALARARLNGELGLRKDFRKALLYAVQGVVTGDAECIEFYNSLTPEQAGSLGDYYAPKMRKRAPGLFSAPSAENRAYKKVCKEMQSGQVFYSGHLVTAAEAGFAEAQCLLGSVYRQGKGVARDVYLAFYWFEQSAARGHVPPGLVLQGGPRHAAGFRRGRGVVPQGRREGLRQSSAA